MSKPDHMILAPKPTGTEAGLGVGAETLNRLRAAGWMVGVHNDYRMNGEARTFWLLTHANGRWIKGEGRTDAEALAEASLAATPTPPTPDSTAQGDGTSQEGGGIYIASKTSHAPRWRQLRADGVPVISTWIDEAGKGETACFADLWSRCIDEAATARAVIVYMEPGEVLKGAFVEAGAALSCGVPVFAVGCDEFSFTNHIGVTRCGSLDDALRQALPPVPADREGGR